MAGRCVRHAPEEQPVRTREEARAVCQELYRARLAGIPALAARFVGLLSEAQVADAVWPILCERRTQATEHCRGCLSLGILLDGDDVVGGLCGTCRAHGHPMIYRPRTPQALQSIAFPHRTPDPRAAEAMKRYRARRKAEAAEAAAV